MKSKFIISFVLTLFINIVIAGENKKLNVNEELTKHMIVLMELNNQRMKLLIDDDSDDDSKEIIQARGSNIDVALGLIR